MSALLSDADCDLDPAALRRATAALPAEDGQSKARLAGFEGGDARNFGFPVDAELRASEANNKGPLLPNEIFLMIAEHLDPGTPSLLALARSCRALYGLLLPRLYEVVRMIQFYERLGSIFPSKKDNTSLSGRWLTVKQLDATLGWRAVDYRLGTVLVASCQHVVKLSCTWFRFESLCESGAQRCRLKVLDIHSSYDEMPEDAIDSYHGMPNTSELKITRYTNEHMNNFFVRSFPNLAKIWFDAWIEHFDDDDPTRLPSVLVSNGIRTWALRSSATLSLAISYFPSFLPTAIVESKDDVVFEFNPQHWRSIDGLGSLKRLELEELDSSMLLLGLPPNLEYLSVYDLTLSFQQDAELGQLAELLSALRHKIQLSIIHAPHSYQFTKMNDERFRRYLAELDVRAQIPGFRLEKLEEHFEAFEERKQNLGI